MSSEVSLSHGSNRTENLERSLGRIDDAVADAIGEKDQVLLKPNFVSSTRQLASTHVDAAESVLEFLEGLGVTRVAIAESSAADTDEAFRNFGFHRLERDHEVELVDLNAGSYRTVSIDYDPHPISVRVAEPLLDDSTFLVSLARLKTHDTVVATLSLKNLLMGSMLKTDEFNDKRRMHQGYEEINHYLAVLATRVFPDLGVIDGYRGMEGNGPVNGTPVESNLAISSLDPLAADYVGLRCMDIDPSFVGYLTEIAQQGLGRYDEDTITVLGDSIEECHRAYRLHDSVDEQIAWLDRDSMRPDPP